MVVEDDFAIRETLRELLEDEGYRVTWASNGQEALARLRDRAPRLILLDLMMPVMDGWEFRRHQLADPRIATTPVVVFTAHRNADDAAARMSAAAALQKPVDVDGLLAVVGRVVGGPSLP
jgi:CheY-like chemotaxis protein